MAESISPLGPFSGEVWLMLLEQGNVLPEDLCRFGMTSRPAHRLVRSNCVSKLARRALWPGLKAEVDWLSVCQSARGFAAKTPTITPLHPGVGEGPQKLLIANGKAVVAGPIWSSEPSFVRVFDLATRGCIFEMSFASSIQEVQLGSNKLFVWLLEGEENQLKVFDLDEGEQAAHCCAANLVRSPITENGRFAVAEEQGLAHYRYPEERAQSRVALQRPWRIIRLCMDERVVLASCYREKDNQAHLIAYSAENMAPLFKKHLLNLRACERLVLRKGICAYLYGSSWGHIVCLNAMTGEEFFCRKVRKNWSLTYHSFGKERSLLINRSGSVDLMMGKRFEKTLPVSNAYSVLVAGDLGIIVSGVGEIGIWSLSLGAKVNSLKLTYLPQSIATWEGEVLIVKPFGGELVVWGKQRRNDLRRNSCADLDQQASSSETHRSKGKRPPGQEVPKEDEVASLQASLKPGSEEVLPSSVQQPSPFPSHRGRTQRIGSIALISLALLAIGAAACGSRKARFVLRARLGGKP